MAYLKKMRESQRACGPASILAIGTANPSNCIYQSDFTDYYFRVTNSDHMTNLKTKLKRICEKTMIKKRYIHLTEEMIKENPNICGFDEASLDVRQEILIKEVPRLGEKAASKALKEWGRPRSDITHIIVHSTGGVDMPGVDYHLIKLLGLNPSTKRVMLYNQGCFAGGTVLRLAKDLAENNAGARVLVVCSELTVILFRGPSENHLDSLVGQALFGDGASSVIVGSDLDTSIERPLFHLMLVSETIIPDSEGAVEGYLREAGLKLQLLDKAPKLVGDNIEKNLEEMFHPLGITDWNSLFWISHPGGPAFLDNIEKILGLKEDKLRVTRHVLSEYGNMASACVLFILDEMRKRSKKERKSTTGEGLDWGVLYGFGPGLTMEAVVLHSVPTEYDD